VSETAKITVLLASDYEQAKPESRQRFEVIRALLGSLPQVHLETLTDPDTGLLAERFSRPHLGGPRSVFWVCGMRTARSIPIAREKNWQTVFDCPLLESQPLFSNATQTPWQWPGVLKAARTAYQEERLCGAADYVVTSSELDATRLRKLVPRTDVRIMEAWLDLGPGLKTSIGAAHGPWMTPVLVGENIQDHLQFAREVIPRLQAALGDSAPRFQLRIASDRKDTQSLRDAGFDVQPLPSEDWTACLREASGAFFPQRSGSDRRLPILQALSCGIPVVSTGAALQGLALIPDKEIFLAESADMATRAWTRLVRTPELRATMTESAQAALRSRYDWRAWSASMEAFLLQLI
jgi:hypothetical protein